MPDIQWLTQWPEHLGRDRDNPFCRASFLGALETTGICTAESGWSPHHLYWRDADAELAMPCYVKRHPWGEYVFDWSWAHAYEQHGLAYYPKLVCAVPYTPSLGPRGTTTPDRDRAVRLAGQMQAEVERAGYSGCHLLFPDAATSDAWRSTDWVERRDVQFHWHNAGYRDFDDFLERFTSRKRKNLRKERRSIADQGLELACFEGEAISAERLRQFYVFYHATYLKRGRHGYFNLAFFQQLLTDQPDSLVLFMAFAGGEAVAAALCFRDTDTLYGRYWGCLEEYNNLHFECCYYQGIDYCIRHRLSRFDPGTQGEHKVARGFEPCLTRSFHWLARPEFQDAVRRFCAEEGEMVDAYRRQMIDALPFRQHD